MIDLVKRPALLATSNAEQPRGPGRVSASPVPPKSRRPSKERTMSSTKRPEESLTARLRDPAGRQEAETFTQKAPRGQSAAQPRVGHPESRRWP